MSSGERQRFDHFETFRVRYSEIDAQGIVFNAHYLTYFDQATTEYFRAVGYRHKDMVARTGLDFHVVRSVVEYKRPIHMDAAIDVGIAPSRIGNSSVTWSFGIFDPADDTLLATGELVWVCARVGAHASHPLPQEFIDTFGPRVRV